MTKIEIQELLKLIKGIYGHRFSLDEMTEKAWGTYLHVFPVHVVKKALDEWIKNHQREKESHPPSASDLMHLSDSVWSRQEISSSQIEDQRKCKCLDGWVHVMGADGCNSLAKCGRCRKIGIKKGHDDKELKIPYLDPETLEVM